MALENKPNEIYIKRVYDAPVATVWDAWTDPEQVKHWWGPRGFTLTTYSKELKPGGIWHYTMHGPDGVDYPNWTVYHEVEPCAKLVYDHGGNEDRPPLFRVTVLFSESDGKTTMEMTMALPTAEEAAATRKFVKEAGGNATWDRLAEYLSETQQGQPSFVINRSFPAPVDLVFKMWTDPVHLAQWQPPAGFDMKFLRADIQAGNSCFFRMSNDSGVTFFARFDYQEITPPSRIVYIQRFCDEAENIARHPALPEFPAAMKTTVVFAAEGEQATRVTITSETLENATTQEIQSFVNERPGMTLGWTGSFDKLEKLVGTAGEEV
ncbi:MAG: SRPBCC family protein [Pirellulaceae bacterium]